MSPDLFTIARSVKKSNSGSQVTVSNDYLVRFNVDGYDITLFADARAIIKGTNDESVARILYSKYIGV